MAIITEHEEDMDPAKQPPSKPKLRNRGPKGKEPDADSTPKGKDRDSKSKTHPRKRSSSNTNPLAFWFYLTVTVSLITLLFVVFSSFSSQDPKSWFLSLPTSLRDHYSKGRAIKVQINPNGSPVDIFTYSDGPRDGEAVLIVHGMGCSSFTFRGMVDHLASKGVFALAIDLPGSGFSDKAAMVESEGPIGALDRLWDMYGDIKEKGLFWGFDNLIENGYVPYEEPVKVQKRLDPLELSSKEVDRVLGQIVDSMGLAPLHLVLHDSALILGADWVSANAGLVRSLTLVDTLPNGTALPLWVLEVPVVREIVLGLQPVFGKMVDFCCSNSMDGSALEAHRALLKARNSKEAIVGTCKKFNYSFVVEEWANSDGVKNLPVQVLWSSNWSKEWSKEGSNLVSAFPKAKFASYASGGRWPQESATVELAGNVLSFISSLPKTVRMQKEEEAPPDHIQKMFDEGGRSSSSSSSGDHHAYDHDHYDHHDDEQMLADGYGMGHGWNI